MSRRPLRRPMLMVHEGGYSPVYVPFCGLAVIEQLSGGRTEVVDPYLKDIMARPGQQNPTPDQAAALRPFGEARSPGDVDLPSRTQSTDADAC